MRVTWEATDIRGGVILGQRDRHEKWLIVYRPGSYARLDNVYNLASLSDGLLAHDEWLTAGDMANSLNRTGEVPHDFLETAFGKGSET